MRRIASSNVNRMRGQAPYLTALAIATLVAASSLYATVGPTESEEPWPDAKPVPTVANANYAVPTTVKGLVSPTPTPGTYVATVSPSDVLDVPGGGSDVPEVEAPPIVCSSPDEPVRNRVLDTSFCLPPNWVDWRGESGVSAASALEEEGEVIIFGPRSLEADAGDDVSESHLFRIRISFAPPDAQFEGCHPALASPVPTLGNFCEDVYDISPRGEATFARTGGLTAWKFLLPVGPRNTETTSWDAGFLYVKVVFRSSERARVEAVVGPLLAGIVTR